MVNFLTAKNKKTYNANMILYTVLGIGFAFLMTVLGAGLVFFFKKEISEKVSLIFYGLSAGIMLSATFWSLLVPSIDYSENLGSLKFLPSIIGIILGALFIWLLDIFMKKFNKNQNVQKSKNFKFFLAVTIHNIPEGLAVGFAFGVAIWGNNLSLCLSALSLSIGIGLQNFPEGLAISLPLRKSLNSTKKAFLYGVLSAVVEPIASIVGIFLAYTLSSVLSYILAFAGGAMIYVLIEELIPEVVVSNEKKGTWWFIIGFCLMMILDIAFG